MAERKQLLSIADTEDPDNSSLVLFANPNHHARSKRHPNRLAAVAIGWPRKRAQWLPIKHKSLGYKEPKKKMIRGLVIFLE